MYTILQRIELLRFIIHYLQACMSIRYIMGTAWSHSSDAYTRSIAIFSLLYSSAEFLGQLVVWGYLSDCFYGSAYRHPCTR